MVTRTRRWIVGLDASDLGSLALREALLTALDRGGEVHVVIAHQPLGDATNLEGGPDDPALARLVDRLMPLVRASVDALGPDAPPVMIHGVIGAAAESLVVIAAALDADAIFVGTHGRTGLKRALRGSVAEEVVRRAGCAVHVVRERHHEASVRWPVHHQERAVRGPIVGPQAFGG
ncbi:MAG: universal stress protein [Deltaproteobacteria bacterium]|nr:universal stress protein [Deltaproteobacteria bacterium]